MSTKKEMAWEFLVLLVLGAWALLQFCSGCSENFTAEVEKERPGGNGSDSSEDGLGGAPGGFGGSEATGGTDGSTGGVDGAGGSPLPLVDCHYPTPEECGSSACQVEMFCQAPLAAYCTAGEGHFYGTCTAGACQVLGVCQ